VLTVQDKFRQFLTKHDRTIFRVLLAVVCLVLGCATLLSLCQFVIIIHRVEPFKGSAKLHM